MGRTTPRQTIPEIWTCGITDLEGFERIHTAALRAAVIPGRLNANGQAEMWTGPKGSARPHRCSRQPRPVSGQALDWTSSVG